MRRRHLILALAALALAGPSAASDKKKGGGASYEQFPTLTAIIVRADGRRGVLTVEAGLDAPDPAVRIRVQEMEPRLRDAYATSLMDIGGTLRPGEPPDLDRLAARLQADTDRILGRPGAKLLLGATILN